MTRGNIKLPEQATKIVKGPTGAIGAVAGSVDVNSHNFLKWVEDGCENDPPLPGKSQVFVLWDKTGLYEFNKSGSIPVPFTSFYAWGSGESIALGAMAAGANAVEAVNLAAKFDIYTGGKVVSYTLKTLSKTKKR